MVVTLLVAGPEPDQGGNMIIKQYVRLMFLVLYRSQALLVTITGRLWSVTTSPRHIKDGKPTLNVHLESLRRRFFVRLFDSVGWA